MTSSSVNVSNFANFVENNDFNFISDKKAMSLLNSIDNNFIKDRNLEEPLRLVLKSFKDGNKNKLKNHINKLLNRSKHFANDEPFDIGDEVGIIRTEHGWHDGTLEGKIISKNKSSTGVWSYQALLKDSVDHIVDIRHTRDARIL
jgi:hypothetical protein